MKEYDEYRPLADCCRPQTLVQLIGQSHLLANEKPLRSILNAAIPPHSMLLWGPPGCGKTSIARLIGNRSDVAWFPLSAVTSGVKEVREVISKTESMRSTGDKRYRVLFIDECHRFNKAQQDAFLPHIESGLFILIGATTENPSFEMNGALLSRLSIYHLQALSEDNLSQILQQTLDTLHLTVDLEARQILISMADGDARRMLNVVERLSVMKESEAPITSIDINRIASERVRNFDNQGDHFYDQISAFQKSIRGSNPDAALYWFCRMLDGGADPRYISRRLIRTASEDIGLADSRALSLALDADEAYRRLGTPEGELSLAQAVVYLASVPKSNAINKAYKNAQAYISKDTTRLVPLHLQNAPTALMKSEGRGRHYRYAHDEPHAYCAGENYFPEEVKPPQFYQPTSYGLEKNIKERLQKLEQLDLQAKRQQK